MSDDGLDEGPRIKPALDYNLGPIEPHTIQDWNCRPDWLGRRADGNVQRDIFALTSHYKIESSAQDDPANRAGLDMETCEIPNDMHITTVCDIDSVIGMVAGYFPIKDEATFLYYMLPDVKQTLSADLHITPITFVGEDGEQRRVAPHRLPNTRFGTIGRLVVRAGFPALIDEPARANMGQPNFVGERYLRLLYDRAIQPATMTTLPENVRRQWPQRYDNEMFRAAPHRDVAEPQARNIRQPQQTGREVHGEDFDELC
ncbi:hypothetical protein FRC10_000770 [Ceratobasidium sp. 414]|nr:hypothetical protein FRC10_000770 [Ceratobasidium sp. 414]